LISSLQNQLLSLLI